MTGPSGQMKSTGRRFSPAQADCHPATSHGAPCPDSQAHGATSFRCAFLADFRRPDGSGRIALADQRTTSSAFWPEIQLAPYRQRERQHGMGLAADVT